jgi:hypothetical protein
MVRTDMDVALLVADHSDLLGNGVVGETIAFLQLAVMSGDVRLDRG